MNPSMAYKSFWLMCLSPTPKTAFAGAEPKVTNYLNPSQVIKPGDSVLFFGYVFFNISNLGFFAPKGNFSVSKNPIPKHPSLVNFKPLSCQQTTLKNAFNVF
jgi:hypothetical protein